MAGCIAMYIAARKWVCIYIYRYILSRNKSMCMEWIVLYVELATVCSFSDGKTLRPCMVIQILPCMHNYNQNHILNMTKVIFIDHVILIIIIITLFDSNMAEKGWCGFMYGPLDSNFYL